MIHDSIAPKPRVPWIDAVIYEAHVRGMTMLSPDVPVGLRGTYAGFAHASVTDHLTGLGVTTVELMPVFAFATEAPLAAKGLTNYWGYNTTDYFAPHALYAAGDDPAVEFRAMVSSLHAAGLEVVLDVAYNHTAPELFDPNWYRSTDVSGCGNTLDSSHPDVQDFIVRSLRWWADEMGVDGFRFDLAAASARGRDDRMEVPGALFTRIADDPVLSDLKLIVEPWDATAEGYSIGGFGRPFAEWNDRFRDDVRDYWRGAAGIGSLATRLAGSSDLFDAPLRSVNFVTCHDGFSLRDQVSYAHRHNEANHEGGLDGHADNRSDNCGAEGPTDDDAIEDRRRQRAANLLATTLLARGVPLVRMGDEFGQTQAGNNNAYCQDNETSWMSWTGDDGWDLRDLIGELTALRRAINGADFLTDAEVTWFGKDGSGLREDDWQDPARTGLGMRVGTHTLWFDTAAQEVWITTDGAGVPRRVTPLGLRA